MRKHLTEANIRAIKPTDKQQEYFDVVGKNGLLLLVSPGKTKTFQVKYRFLGRQRRLTLGRFPTLNLANARRMARDAMLRVYANHDPAAERKTERNAHTFSVLASDFIEAKKSLRTVKELQRVIDVELLPAWANRKVPEIAQHDVSQLIQRVVNRNAPIAANRLLTLIRSIFNYGIQERWIELNPTRYIKMPSPKRERDRVLNADEVETVWKALDEQPSGVRSILRMQLLTGQRIGEIRKMRAKDVDLTTQWWTIPREFAKNDLSHRVPLSPPAMALIEESIAQHNSQWVFPAILDTTLPFQYPTLVRAILRMQRATGVQDWGSHDLRRTVASFLTGGGVPPHTVRKILNHREPGVIATYDRHSYDPEKRAALEDWARRLDGIVSGRTNNVVAFVASGKI